MSQVYILGKSNTTVLNVAEVSNLSAMNTESLGFVSILWVFCITLTKPSSWKYIDFLKCLLCRPVKVYKAKVLNTIIWVQVWLSYSHMSSFKCG